MEAKMPTEPDGEFIVKYKNGNVPPKRQEAIDKFKTKNDKAAVKTVATKLSTKDAEGEWKNTLNLEKDLRSMYGDVLLYENGRLEESGWVEPVRMN